MLLKKTFSLARLAKLSLYSKAWREAGGRLRQRVMQSVTLGVRGIVLDGEGRVLLVRHAYRDGWFFPGGGVEPDETLSEAMERELSEEAHIALDAPPLLHGLFVQKKRWRTNHVACYVVRRFHQTSVRVPDWEIAETGFFSPQNLPDGTSPATRARLREVLEGLPPSDTW